MISGYLISSPLGEIALRVEGDFLTGLFFTGQKYFPNHPFSENLHGAPALVHNAQEQIAEYFSGERRSFTVALRLRGTPFQEQIWQKLATIAYGDTVSYSSIAIDMGLGAGYGRAVGNAVGRNPVSIIIPCHRVVSTLGQLTGYAGGTTRKATLLALERPI